MDVFDLFAKIKLDSSGYEKGLSNARDLAGRVSSGIMSAFKVATDTIAGVGSALVGLTKQSLDAVAVHEQLVGGVDKIFGEASKKVQEYADQAFMTAGVSANQYMETVTGFSASLLQSLGGDTDKAAEYANRAIIDMSDNVNTYGSSMQSVQYAYQGFAKQNYMMLDNLKLGYGGTKEEMERLIADASTMTSEMAELGVTVDADSMSFGNIINAISVMQKHMKISGTTSKEASNTISGSIGSMKAAWQNFLTGTGSPDQYIEVLKKSVGNVTNNLSKIIPKLATGLTELVKAGAPVVTKTIRDMLPVVIDGVSSLVSGLAGYLPSLVRTTLPSLTKGAVNVITGLASSLPKLVSAFSKTIPEVVKVIMSRKGDLEKAGLQLIKSLFPKGFESVTEITEKAVGVVTDFCTAVTNPDRITTLLDTGFEIINAVFNGLLSQKSLDKLFEAGPEIIKNLQIGISSFLFGRDKTTPGGLFGAVLNIAQKIRDYLEDPKSLEKIRKAAIDVLENTGKFMVDNVGLLLKYTQQIGQALAEGIIAAFISDFKHLFGGLDERELMNEYLTSDTTETYDQFRQRRMREMGRESSREIEERYSSYVPSNTYMTTDAILDYNRDLPDVARQAIRRSRGYATGGVIDKPTYALVGEDGAEAVMPLEKNTGWIDQLAERLGGGGVVIQFGDIHVNGTENVGREVVSQIDSALKQYQIMQQRGIGGTGWR